MSSDILNDPMPNKIAIGWIEQSQNRRDAVYTARGHIDARFTAKDASWYAIAPFMGGWLWEVHEGGPGKSHLNAIMSELTENTGGSYWIPVGTKKVLQVSMRDGKPFAIILSESESLKVRNSGQAPLLPKGRMQRFASRGTGMFVFGATLAGSSFVYFLTTLGFYLSVWQPGPTVRAVDLAQMPHSQWAKVENTSPEEIVSKLEMKGGKWLEPVIRKHIIGDLEKERQRARQINADFEKQQFGFEKKAVGDKLAPQAEAPQTKPEAATGPIAANESPAYVTPPQPAVVPSQPAVVAPTPAVPAPQEIAPSQVSPTPVAPAQPPASTPNVALPGVPASPTAPTDPANPAVSGKERQQRVMEQLRQMRERNAAQQKQAADTQKAVDGATPSSTPPATEVQGAKK